MAYGIWLYKTIETQHGDVTLYIKKRNYTGEAIEINALAPDSLTLSIDGDKLTDPIIGSTLTFGIIDTEQIDTTQFFTPDATLYAVELYRGGTLEWSGYLTPDSYQENLSYRDTISLVARDNLGRLEEFKIEKHQGLQNIEILIDSFLAEVGCPQVLNWQCDKVATEKGEGVEIDTPIRDMWVNTRLWIGKTYRDAVEDILKGLGCQMRFAGNNNLVIVSISDFAEFANQSAIFINKSGHKEIIPAWRDATITQDYGLIENFFDGQIKESDMGAKTYFKPYEVANDWYNTSSRGAEIYFANQWMWENNIEDDQSDSLYPVAKSGGGMASWGVMVNSTNSILTLKMKINNTLRRLANLVFDSTSNLHVGGDNLPSYSLVYQFKIQLKKADGTIYDMTKGGWETSSPSVITFAAEECNYNDEGTWNKDIDVSITINSIPFDGELLIGIGSVMYEGYPDDIVYFGKIKDITLSFNNDIGQKSSRVQIDTKHNINGEVQINVGQVPRGKGDHLAYAGGLFAADGEPLSFFKRKTNDILAYNLLELVGRENIHLQKRNFAALSGEMTAKDTTITLGANIAYKGKYYALISASLNVLRNTLSVTRMQEVEDYQIAELTIIDSPLESSQGNKVGSGNNEVIQFSNDAGNAKRLYELQDATEQDQEGAYIIIDKSSMDSAKKLPISAISSALNKAFRLHYNEDGVLVSVEVLANLWTNFGITAGGEGTGSGGGTGGATSLEGLNDVSLSALVDGQSLVWSSTMNKWINKTIESGLDEDALSAYLIANNYAVKGDIPSALKSPYKLSFGDKSYDGSAEVTITAADLGALTEHQSLDGYVNTIETTGNGNAVTSVVKNGKKLTFTKGATYLTTHQDISHLLSKEEAADTYQVKGNYLTSITSKMVTDALTYTPLANTTKYALSDSVGGNALDSAKLGGQLPSHYATATSVTKVSDDLSTFKTLFDSMFEKKDGKIHAKLTLWTDYALVAGGEGDGTGGGGGGLTAFSIIINNKTYNSDNGVATITEQLQPLITASNKLDYSLISGTPTSLPASDVSEWAKAATKPTYTFSEITSKPTTLSGYGITDGVIIDNSDSADNHTKSSIGYGQGKSALSGGVITATLGNYGGQIHIPINASYSMTYRGRNGSWNEWKTILDSNNYSSYALPLSGGTMTGAIVVGSFTSFGVSGDTFYLGNPSYPVAIRSNGTTTINGNTLYHSGNFNPANYLPLSGGTISGDICLNYNLSRYSRIIFKDNRIYTSGYADSIILVYDGNDSSVGSIGLYGGIGGVDYYYFGHNSYNGDNLRIYPDKLSFGDYTLLHSGNIGSYNAGSADILAKVYANENINYGRDHIAMRMIHGTASNSVSLGYPRQYVSGLSVITSYTGWQMVTYGGSLLPNPYFRKQVDDGSWLDWKQLAFLDDNVASATKAKILTTSDGTSPMIHDSGATIYVGDSVYPSRTLDLLGNVINLRYGTSASYGLILNSSGNVTIGASDLASTTTKLYVAGGIRFTPRTIWGQSFDGTGNVSGIAYFPNGDLIYAKDEGGTYRYVMGLTSGLSLGYGSASAGIDTYILGKNIHFRYYDTDYKYAMSILNNGNVLIGTTTDNGAKLQVNGDCTITGTLRPTYGIYNAREMHFNDGTANRGIFRGSYWSSAYSDNDLFFRIDNSIFAGNISASGAITAGTASDRRLKDNICTINQNQAIETLMALNPITYEWNDKAKELGGYEGISQGFIAQEYESIIPNSGRAIWGKYRAIDYTKAIPYIVSVEQNHETRIRQLEEELNKLRREYYGI